jgi:shikimate kinase
MRAGKTTLGALLARELGRPFVDLDERVEREAGRSIAEIWATEGEASFRYREREALVRVAGGRMVIATGGGTTVSPGNREILAGTGLVLWLQASFEVIWSRAKGERSGLRPLWRDEGSLRELHRSRERTYAFAHHTVRISGPGREREARAQACRLADLVRRTEGAA